MTKNYVPLPTRIKEATAKLKSAGYVVINTDDENFAILAERKKFICSNHNEFFKFADELTKI
jgi:tRNA G46 methylase TrmB